MKKIALVLLAGLILGTACKKTVESEKRAWEVNLKEINGLKYEYPSFSAVLAENIKVAEMVMKESETISDEKLKIEKMSEANKVLNALFVRNLKEIKSIKNSIRTKSTDVRGLKLEFNEISASNQAISTADRAIYESDSKLRSTVTTTADAEALSSLVLSDLKNAVSGLEAIISKVRERENLEKKKTEQIAAEKAAVEKKKQEEAQPIKCSYCGTLNLATAKFCKSCGAPLTK